MRHSLKTRALYGTLSLTIGLVALVPWMMLVDVILVAHGVIR